MSNRLFVILHQAQNISCDPNNPTKLSCVSNATNNMVATVLHELHVIHNPFANVLLACLSGIHGDIYNTIRKNFTSVLVVTPTTHQLIDCQSWAINRLTHASVFLILFQQDYDEDRDAAEPLACEHINSNMEELPKLITKKEEPVSSCPKKEECHDTTCVSGAKKEELENDQFSSPDSFATAKSLSEQSSEAVSAGSSTSSSSSSLSHSETKSDCLDSLLGDLDSDADSDFASSCSYELRRVDAHMAQTRAMTKKLQDDQKITNDLNKEFGFHPIPFGERLVEMRNATKSQIGPFSKDALEREPEQVTLRPSKQGGPDHDKYNDDLLKSGNPIAKICNNIARRFDRIGKAVICTCDTRKECQASGHRNNNCELCTKQVGQPKYHHAKASFNVHDQDKNLGTGCVDLICRGHRDLVMVLVVSICDTNVVLALPVKSKKTNDMLPVIWRLFSLSRYFYGIAIWRLHGDRESALFHARNQLAPILCTFTISGDHAGNSVSERYNRTLSILAAKSLSHLTSSATRRNLWARSVTHAAHMHSIKNLNDPECKLKNRRMCLQTVIPFLALGIVPPKLGLKPSRTDDRNDYALYIGPCDLTPMASLVLLIEYNKQSATSTFCKGKKFISVRGFKPETDAESIPILPNVSFPDKEVEEIEETCNICNIKRYFEPDQHEDVMKRFADGIFNCSEVNATCGEEKFDTCRIRKGPLKGSKNRLGGNKVKLALRDLARETTSEFAPPRICALTKTNVSTGYDLSAERRHTQIEKDRLRQEQQLGCPVGPSCRQRKQAKRQRKDERRKGKVKSKDGVHVKVARQPLSDATQDEPFHETIDADYLPDYNHGINADIDDMMEETRESFRDISAFKASVAADMVTLNGVTPSVKLTKLLTEKKDLETVESVESIRVEANQLFNVDRVVAPPVEQDAALAAHPDATASPAMLIVSIKNYEFMLSKRKELKNEVKLARASLQVECQKIRNDFSDSNSAAANLSGLSNGGSLRTRVEKAIALEARIKELDEIADMIKVEDVHDDGGDFVPDEFKFDTSDEAMKGASSAVPKWKCRVVVRGDIVQRLDEFISRPTFRPVKPGDDAPSVWSPTVSLSGFRAVVAHSVLHKFDLRSLDLPSAFVQVAWPDHLPPHFLRFPDNIREVMTDEFKGKDLKSPVWQMVRMIYGHRLSGWTFCRRLQEILLANGFVPCDWCSAVMMHPVKNICMCTYVDDLAFSCDTDGESFLMKCIRDGGLKIGDEAEACKKYLGTKVTVMRGDDSTTVRFDQNEYAVAICEMYHDLYGKMPHKRKFPGSWNVNLGSEPQRDLHRATPCDSKVISEDADRRRRQVLVGMLLWHARSVRCDIAGYVNFLATRIHVWSARDDTFLSQLIGFLRYSATKALTWTIPHNVKLSVNVMFDANLQVPRSHCSYNVALGNSENQCFGLIDWSNKRAQLSCTASAASELCAAHYTTTNVTGMCEFLDECIASSESPREFSDTTYQLFGDNISSLLAIQKGFTPMAGAWAANRAYGLRLAVMHQQFAARVFRLAHVRSAVNIADLASKVSHSRETFLFMSELCGLSFGRPRFVVPIERDSAPNRKLTKTLM